MADLATIIAGAGSAVGALASALVSVSKSGKVADDVSTLSAVVSKFRQEFEAHKSDTVRNAEAIRDELDKLTRRIDRRATGSMPSAETYAGLQRQIDDLDRRSRANEEKINDQAERLEKHTDAYRAWTYDIVQRIATIATSLDERVARRMGRGS